MNRILKCIMVVGALCVSMASISDGYRYHARITVEAACGIDGEAVLSALFSSLATEQALILSRGALQRQGRKVSQWVLADDDGFGLVTASDFLEAGSYLIAIHFDAANAARIEQIRIRLVELLQGSQISSTVVVEILESP